MTNDVREGLVGATAGIGSAVVYWLKLAGDVGSAVASVLGALTAAVVFWRVIRNRNQA